MGTLFQDLLKKQKENTIEAASKAASEEYSKSFNNDDEKVWRPGVDKAGNGFAIIRFLPAPDSDIPWIKYFTHGFKTDSGKWFIENCPTGIKEQCPVCVQNSKYWNSGIESDKEIARARKRRTHYVSNILVQKDTANPENEGQVFLYKYGGKIFEKIMNALQPPFEDETPFDPFNVFTGASFKVKIKQVGGYWNYDSSEFSPVAPLCENESDLEKIFEQLIPIREFLNPEKYKSFNELQAKLNMVLGGGGDDNSNDSPMKSEIPSAPFKTAPEPTTSSANEDSEEDDDMAYFKRLAESV